MTYTTTFVQVLTHVNEYALVAIFATIIKDSSKQILQMALARVRRGQGSHCRIGSPRNGHFFMYTTQNLLRIIPFL